ncbi:hypothetical protein [Martelella radicis]|uniref:Putative DNA-binding transcriptional regulator n=1 Tax=Martelella radicis TaxID=1397476 RepID=A0A7W6KFM2_9HYPH|nr:hypothetical protein [Martelella radicis]MBB4120212.1 putative DNA-binding transcriptional regulator [Martelella radicis]
MFTLAEIIPVFASLDNVPAKDIARYEKALRNLVQRNHLPPSDQRGRVFMYDEGALSAIRLVQIANEFGLDRTAIDPLARWLAESGTRRRKVTGGWLGVTHSAEAVERVQNGEEFSVSLVLGADYRYCVEASWSLDQPKSERVENSLRLAGLSNAPAIARFSLPASSIIVELLSSLNEVD